MLTQSESTQLKADVSALIDAVTEGASPTPPTGSLSVNPSTIEEGQTAMVSWSVMDATGVFINGQSEALSGSRNVSPADDTLYILVASGPGGTITLNANLVVAETPPPPPVVTGETIGPGLINFEEIHVHTGNTLTILPGTELVRIDVPPVDPAHGDGGIVVHGTLIAERTPGQQPIIIRSANPTGHRGHLMIHGIGKFEGVEFRNYGRTKIDTINATTNPIARYPVHWHLAGDSQGSFIRNCLIEDDMATESNRRYGIVIHGTNYVDCRNNTIRNKAGAGIYIEDGTEHDNVIEDNLIEYIYGTAARPDAYPPVSNKGHDGSGIWAASAKNRINRNTMRFCKYAGLLYYVHQQLGGDVIMECKDNLAEDSRKGLEIWGAGGGTSTVENFTARRMSRDGYTNYPCHEVKFKNFVAQNCLIGFFGGDYLQKGHRIEGGSITACTTGLSPSTIVKNDFIVDGMTLQNTVDVYMQTPYSSGGWTYVLPLKAVFKNCLFNGQTKIDMKYRISPNTHLLQTYEVHVENWQQQVGQNYRIYFTQQKSDFIVPEIAGTYAKGAQAPGLTNQQHSDQFGTCIAGAIAQCTGTLPGVLGYACQE